MYNAVLALHSWLRWAILLLGLIAVVRAFSGRSSGRPWTGADQRVSLWFTSALDLQMLVGLLLYFVFSPITTAGIRDMGAAMANPGLRFYTVEHPFGMILALVLAHIGRARIRKAADAASRHRTALIFCALALIVIVLTVPWPGRPVIGRPLFRMGG